MYVYVNALNNGKHNNLAHVCIHIC